MLSAWSNRIALIPFVWSGGNTLRARERAAAALRQHIEAIVGRYPGAAHYLLAHSHTGNIALYALRDDAVARRIRGVACLSTPFLHLRRRKLGRITVSSIVAGLAVWMIGGVAILCQSLLRWSEDAAVLTALVTTASVVTPMVRFRDGRRRRC
jgi:alpha-beta hydrolase superfamily lysophospholipase